MRGIGGSTLRGGQTVFHGIRMWGQLFRAAVFFAAFTTVACRPGRSGTGPRATNGTPPAW